MSEQTLSEKRERFLSITDILMRGGFFLQTESRMVEWFKAWNAYSDAKEAEEVAAGCAELRKRAEEQGVDANISSSPIAQNFIQSADAQKVEDFAFPVWNPVCYINPKFPGKWESEFRAGFPDGEAIYTDSFNVAYMDNSVAVQQSLIHAKRFDLLRPLTKE